MRERTLHWLAIAVALSTLAACATPKTVTKQEAQLTDLAEELARRGDPTSAVTLYARAAAKMPDNPDVLLALGDAQLQNGDPQAATEAFQQAYRLRNGDAQAVLGLGYAALVEGRLKRAHNLIHTAAPKLTTFKAYNLLGVVSILTGAFDQAIPAFAAALEKNPSNLDLMTNQALAYALSNDMGNAIQRITAVTASPLAEPHHTRRAVLILVLANQDTQAEELLEDLPKAEQSELLAHARRIRDLPDTSARAAAIGFMPVFATAGKRHS